MKILEKLLSLLKSCKLQSLGFTLLFTGKQKMYLAILIIISIIITATDPPTEDKKGLLLGGRISANELEYFQDLVDGCSLVGLVQTEPAKRNTFVITSADYCNREGETLKYNQEFLLTLESSLHRKVRSRTRFTGRLLYFNVT